jgi:hypothetical protein
LKPILFNSDSSAAGNKVALATTNFLDWSSFGTFTPMGSSDSASFRGTPGNTCFFYSIARDLVGNAEQPRVFTGRACCPQRAEKALQRAHFGHLDGIAVGWGQPA